jgi:hypothetical protein
VSLEAGYVAILDGLARRVGSKSNAVRELLAAYEKAEHVRALEEGYRQYFSDPEAEKRDRELTEEMLTIASRPREERGAKRRGDERERAARRGVSRRVGGSRGTASQETPGAGRSERRR